MCHFIKINHESPTFLVWLQNSIHKVYLNHVVRAALQNGLATNYIFNALVTNMSELVSIPPSLTELANARIFVDKRACTQTHFWDFQLLNSDMSRDLLFMIT